MSFQRVDRHAFEAEKAKLNLVNADMEMNRLQNSQRHAPAIEYNKKMNEKPRTSEKDVSAAPALPCFERMCRAAGEPLLTPLPMFGRCSPPR